MTEQGFDKYINSNAEVLAILGSPQCPHCVATKAALAGFCKAMPQVATTFINIDRFGALGDKYRVRYMPTIVYFRGGKLVKRVSGARDAAGLVAVVGARRA